MPLLVAPESVKLCHSLAGAANTSMHRKHDISIEIDTFHFIEEFCATLRTIKNI